MGCIWNKIPPREDDIKCIALVQVKGIQKEVIIKNKTVHTPSGHLIERMIPIRSLPPFVVTFYVAIRNNFHFKVSQNSYKDLYYIADKVLSVEYTSLVNYNDREKLFKRMKTLTRSQHILIPDRWVYLPISETHGVCIQRMKYCRGGDMFEIMLESTGQNDINISRFAFSMASTLKELHENNIFLTDLKLENILYSDTFQFTDLEYAFIDKPFVPDDAESDDRMNNAIDYIKSGRKWVRTHAYVPTASFPCTKTKAIQNDVYALAKCIGILIASTVFGITIKLFDENLIDKIEMDYPMMWKHVYIRDCVRCIKYYAKYANTDFLDKIIETYYKTKL